METIRNIRLKEHGPNKDTVYVVADKYRNVSNESLGEGPFRIRTDPHGFIATGNPAAAGLPVAFLGDSFVESTYASEQSRFLSQVERATGYRCLNGGYSGSTTLHMVNAMINKVYPVLGVGGRVVLFVGQTDAATLDYEATYWTSHKRGTPLTLGAQATASLPEGPDAIQRVARLAVDSAAALGIELVLAVTPFATPDFSTDRAIRAQYKRNSDAYHRKRDIRNDVAEATRQVAKEKQVHLIDGHAFMGGNTDYFYDELHLNEAGQTRFAKFLADELQRIF